MFTVPLASLITVQLPQHFFVLFSISCMLLGFVPIGSHCSSEAGVIVPFPKKFFFLLFSFFSWRVSEGFVDCVGWCIRVLVFN